MLPPAEYLRGLKPFSFLNENELKVVLEGLESDIFKSGKTIFKRGKKPLKYVYLIKCGRVELTDENSKEVLKDGDLFGVASAITGNPPRFTAKALEDTVCFLIKRDKVLDVFNTNDKFREFLRNLKTA
jgi:CBS domain-containing protein